MAPHVFAQYCDLGSFLSLFEIVHDMNFSTHCWYFDVLCYRPEEFIDCEHHADKINASEHKVNGYGCVKVSKWGTRLHLNDLVVAS